MIVGEHFAECGVPQNFVPKVKAGHVIPDVTLDRLKKRLNEVRGSLVECPLVRSGSTSFQVA